MTASFRYTPDQIKALALMGGDARHIMLYGGSRSAKTFVIVCVLVARALRAPGSRHAIFRHRFNHVKTSIGLETLPAVMAKRYPGVAYKIDKTDWVVRFPGGSEIWLCGLDDKERTEKVLGKEYASLFFNECSQIAYASALMARTRLAQKTDLVNRAFYDCNPPGTKHWTSLLFIARRDPASKPAGGPLPNPGNYESMLMNPYGNRDNLAPDYIAELENLPEAQRNRFLLGKFTSDLDNALWTSDTIFHASPPPEEERQRVVVAVDPSGCSGPEDKRSDAIGIVGACRTRDKRYSVLADRSMRGSPKQWAVAAIKLHDELKADCIVAESNFGGAMVESTIRQESNRVKVKLVNSSRGKHIRAEPISLLYARGEVSHAERFGELEDQMLNMTTAGYMGERSPDNLDAAVFALTELSLGNQITFGGVSF